MTEEQKSQIKAFRNNGLGYKLIAKELGISVNSVKSFCRRNEHYDTPKDETPRCEQCGKALQNIPGQKKKRFCSDRCRQTWWNSHLDIVKRKAVYVYICPVVRSFLYTAMPRESIAVISVMLKEDMEVLEMNNIPVGERYTLTIKEAAQYFNIGIKKMRRLAEENLGVFAVLSGNRYLIIRTKFEEYLLGKSTI